MPGFCQVARAIIARTCELSLSRVVNAFASSFLHCTDMAWFQAILEPPLSTGLYFEPVRGYDRKMQNRNPALSKP